MSGMDGKLLIAAWLLALPAVAQDLVPRQVAAPPSDILAGFVRLPDPASVPTVSAAVLLPLRFARESGKGWAAEASFPVDGTGDLELGVLSPDAGRFELFARAPGAELRRLDDRLVVFAGEGLPGWVVARSRLRSAPEGSWNVRVEVDDARGARPPAESWLLAKPASSVRLETFVTTQRLVGGEPIGIAAGVSGGRVESGRVFLDHGGSTRELAMSTDGAGGGLFGALVPDDVRGDLRARVEVNGTTAEGRAFLRSAQLSFTVLEPRLLLEPTAQARVIDAGHLAIEIGILPLAPPQRLHLSGEIWGQGEPGRMMPLCWLSRMTAPGISQLVLDLRWIALAGARAPFELREVRAQDPDTEIVLDRAARIPLETPVLPRLPRTTEVTTEMLLGTPTPSVTARGLFPGLVLVHGYCSGGAIWPPADFTQPKLDFLDPNQNRTHDQFAQMIAQQAAAAGLTSFGVVAHSQGGCAALHLLTYYQSGLDLAPYGRKIQSVATPYQGTPLASWGGFACGVNPDMTPSGSATWLAGIPSWARAEVSYWTTANAGSACQWATDFLLSDPEDGTVERSRGQLPGANSMGHVTGWCHTTGMSNPANYTDHARNQAMNAAAAR